MELYDEVFWILEGEQTVSTRILWSSDKPPCDILSKLPTGKVDRQALNSHY